MQFSELKIFNTIAQKVALSVAVKVQKFLVFRKVLFNPNKESITVNTNINAQRKIHK